LLASLSSYLPATGGGGRWHLHPLAATISPAAGLSIPAAMEFHTEPGLGVSALVEGKRVAGQLRLVST